MKITLVSQELLREVFADMTANGWGFTVDTQSRPTEDGKHVQVACNLRWYRYGQLKSQADYDEALAVATRRVYERNPNRAISMTNIGE